MDTQLSPRQSAAPFSPPSPEMVARQADALWQARRFQEAFAIYQQLTERHPDYAAGWMGQGLYFEKTRQVDQAISAFQQVLRLAPAHPHAHGKLGRIYEKLQRYDEALPHILHAEKQLPNHAEYPFCLAKILTGLARYDEALAAAQRALALIPEHPSFMVVLGNIYMEQKCYREAQEQFQLALVRNPHLKAAYFNLAAAQMHLGRFAEATKNFAASLVLEPSDTAAISYYAHCLREIGDEAAADAIEDQKQLVRFTYLGAPDSANDVSAFHAELKSALDAHPHKIWEKAGHATRNGYHTDNLLRNPDSPFKSLEGLLRREVDAYFAHAKAVLKPDHPFLKAIPEQFRLHLWAVLMQDGGHQLAHTHAAGWMSGCFYLRIPKAVEAADETTRAGWIEFGMPGYDLPYSFTPKLCSKKPEEGLLAMFPSYMFHRTIPFSGDEERISLAFDVVPLAGV